MNTEILQAVFFIVLLVTLSIPLGLYIFKVMDGQRVFLSPALAPVEKVIYKMMGVRPEEEMTAKRYLFSLSAFSAVSLLFLFLLQLLQGILPFNPEKFGGVNAGLAFNTSASFVSNTNWQAYSGENTLSYLTQALGLTVQNFVTPAVGCAVLFVLIRGFILKQKDTLGNFWKDITRVILYVFIPLSLVLAIVLVSQGVVQSLGSYHTVITLEKGVEAKVPVGPAASQIAIKQLGTNGGGFFGANSAHPLENPTSLSNLLEMISILLIPAALCVTFGRAVGRMKEGRTIYIAMLLVFVIAAGATIAAEVCTAPAFSGMAQAGSMEGKEVIHGVGTSALWAAVTTAASNGSVNAMLDSFTPLGGLVPLFLMQLGEVIFGGAGSGLYGMVGFVLLAVFISGLMVGRTPEYISKKIEPYDMKMVCLIVLTPPLVALVGTAVAVMIPAATSWLTNPGPHGFSEILYAFVSMGSNNGSAFAGFNGNTPFTNITGGLIMLIVRFVPITAVILLAGNLARKKNTAPGDGTLSTTSGLFIGVLIGTVLLVASLSFLPALALGPIAEAVK